MTDAAAEPTLRHRLGGRWAISWQAYAITAPLALGSLVLGGSRSWADVPRWLLIGAIAVAAAGAWILLLDRTAFRHRAVLPVPVGVTVAAAVSVIAVFVAVATLLRAGWGIPSGESDVPRPIPTLIIGTAWSIGLVLFLEARARFAAERQALVERAVRQQLLVLQEAEVADRLSAALRNEIAGHLAEARQGVERHLALATGAGNAAAAAADDLRRAARGTVRPLSHELAERTERSHPVPGITAVLRNIIGRQPFRPLTVSLVYVITTAPREIDQAGAARGLMAVAITVALICATMTTANITMRRWPEHHAALFLAGIVLVQAPSIVLPPFVAELTGAPIDWPNRLVSVAFGVVVILATSGFGSLRASRRDLLRTFASEVGEEEVATIARSEALAAATREAAMALHGPVQTRLVACAMAIEHAAAAGDLASVQAALEHARAILERPLAEPVREQGSLAEQLARKATLWQGLAQVTVEIDPAVAGLIGSIAEDAAAAVEEGIANAIQHGAATAVTVDVTSARGELVIVVTDDGSGPGGGAAGLGSSLLDRIAPAWTLQALGSRTRLTVPLTLTAPAPTIREAGSQG